jgi:hypothetical protein
LYGFQVDSIRNVDRLHRVFAQEEWLGRPLPTTRLQTRFPRFHDTPLPAVSFLIPLRGALLTRDDAGIRKPVEGPLAPLQESAFYSGAVMATYFPLAFFLLIPWAAWLLATRWRNRYLRSKWLVIAAWPLLYAASALPSPYFWGSRHAFPLYPLTLVLSGVVIGKLGEGRGSTIALSAAVALTAAETCFFLATGKPWSLWVFAVGAA